MNCPNCGAPVRASALFAEDLRHVSCDQCPAILSVRTQAALLPALAVIFLGVPIIKAVEAGWLPLPLAIVSGLAVLLGSAVVGYRLSSVKLVRMRHQGAR